MVVTLEDVHVTSPCAGVSVVTLSGEHDLATASSISELLDSLLHTSDLVVTDVSAALFIDSSILGVLLRADKSAQARGKDFRIQLGTEAIVKRVFQISGVLDVVTWAQLAALPRY